MAFPGSYNFNYYRGDTAEFVIRPKTANGSAFDLTGFSADFFIANTRGPNPTQSYEAQAVVDGATDTVTCTILPGVGRDIAAGTYVYDVQIDNGPTEIYTILTGTITVTNDITGADES
jgi:hypothetical protein